MTLLGLTGGVGMGKSPSAGFLEQFGVPIVDTDVLARRVVEPGQPALAEVQRAFGNEVIDAQGCLRRDELARIVFGDDARRQELEAILHPRIRDLWLAQADVWRVEGKPLGGVVIPLLFEIGAASQFDRIICSACSDASQRQRLLDRGWSPRQIEQRVAAQLPTPQKMEVSHYVVWTEPPLEAHAAQLRKILEDLARPGI